MNKLKTYKTVYVMNLLLEFLLTVKPLTHIRFLFTLLARHKFLKTLFQMEIRCSHIEVKTGLMKLNRRHGYLEIQH